MTGKGRGKVVSKDKVDETETLRESRRKERDLKKEIDDMRKKMESLEQEKEALLSRRETRKAAVGGQRVVQNTTARVQAASDAASTGPADSVPPLVSTTVEVVAPAVKDASPPKEGRRGRPVRRVSKRKKVAKPGQLAAGERGVAASTSSKSRAREEREQVASTR